MKKTVALLLALVIAITSVTTVLADTAYIVQRGDTLYRIAARFGVSVQAIAAANGISNVNVIRVGQRLNIPGPNSTPAPTRAPWSGQYVVQRGDTLWRIAQRFVTKVEALKTANNLRSNLIYPGQILIIPSGQPVPTAHPPKPTISPPTPQVCAINWFFSNRPGGCPAAAPVDSWAAAQRFERGLMIWVAKTDTFYVLPNLGGASFARTTVITGPLKFLPGANQNNRVSGVPAGYHEPVSGFGLLWRGEVENVPNLRAQLGWALQPEYGFTTTYQCEAYPSGLASLSCFWRNPEGGILVTYYVPNDGFYWNPRP